MPYLLISDFSNGLDLRRPRETAPSGSSQILRNAFVNEGGQIEKRKAFVLQENLTTFGQGDAKGMIAGPYPVVGENVPTVLVRYRGDTDYGPFEPTQFRQNLDPVTGQVLQRYHVKRSDTELTNHSLHHVRSSSAYNGNLYTVETYFSEANSAWREIHIFVSDPLGSPVDTVLTENQFRAFSKVLKQKNYIVEGDTVFASALGDPSDMSGTGSWVTDLKNQGPEIGDAVAIGDYFGQLVIFGKRGIMFWSVDPDPDLNQYLRAIDGSTFAPRSVIPYGSGDILYLSRNGIRSLQARDSSNFAQVSDIGSPIDLLIRKDLEVDEDDEDLIPGTTTFRNNARFYELATATVLRETGQFMLALKDSVYVLSRFTGAGVQAWSTYDLPRPVNPGGDNGEIKAQWVADWCEVGDTIMMRNFADEFYLLGGADGTVYDNSEVEVVLPFMDMGRPGHVKNFTGFDAVCSGSWKVEFSTFDPGPGQEIEWQGLAEVCGSTRADGRIDLNVSGTQIALRLTTVDAFDATISELLIHYEDAHQK